MGLITLNSRFSLKVKQNYLSVYTIVPSNERKLYFSEGHVCFNKPDQSPAPFINRFEQSKVSSCENFAYVVRRDMDLPEADKRP